LGRGKRTPEIEVTLSKKSNSLSNMSRASGVKLSIILSLTAGSKDWKALPWKEKNNET
jgi:hypothetical protein